VNPDPVVREYERRLKGPWTQPLREAGVAYDTRLERGGTADALLRVTAEEDADLIVIGGQRHHSCERDPTHRLLKRANSRLVVVPEREGARTGTVDSRARPPKGSRSRSPPSPPWNGRTGESCASCEFVPLDPGLPTSSPSTSICRAVNGRPTVDTSSGEIGSTMLGGCGPARTPEVSIPRCDGAR